MPEEGARPRRRRVHAHGGPVVRPVLPEGVTTLDLRGVRLGEGRADLRFHRRDRGAEVEVLGAEGMDVTVRDA